MKFRKNNNKYFVFSPSPLAPVIGPHVQFFFLGLFISFPKDPFIVSLFRFAFGLTSAYTSNHFEKRKSYQIQHRSLQIRNLSSDQHIRIPVSVWVWLFCISFIHRLDTLNDEQKKQIVNEKSQVWFCFVDF